MHIPSLLFICPIYGQYAYAKRAVQSFFANSPPNAKAYVVDDGGPASWLWRHSDEWLAGIAGAERITIARHGRTMGLTAGWNEGLAYARSCGFEYALPGNSDLVFTKHCLEGMRRHLDDGAHLVGPLSNAPGIARTPNGNLAHRALISNYFPDYQLTDTTEYLDSVGQYVYEHNKTAALEEQPINGFCMLAQTDIWWAGAFDKEHVFDPKNVMKDQEFELQTRWFASGRRIGFSPASFVFHYRSVSRGNAFRTKGWFRNLDLSNSCK